LENIFGSRVNKVKLKCYQL